MTSRDEIVFILSGDINEISQRFWGCEMRDVRCEAKIGFNDAKFGKIGEILRLFILFGCH